MTPSALCSPEVVSRGDNPAAINVADLLSLGAAPTFAFMAALTSNLSGGAHETLCSAAAHASVLSGMVPMYVLMSAFHFAPWLKLISRWRSGAERHPHVHGICTTTLPREIPGTTPGMTWKGEHEDDEENGTHPTRLFLVTTDVAVVRGATVQPRRLVVGGANTNRNRRETWTPTK